MDFATINNMDNEEIIKIVAEDLEKQYDSFDISLFDTIQVKKNQGSIELDEEQEDSCWVSFQMSIRYIPQNSCYYYGIGTDPVSNFSSLGSDCNPRDYITQEEPKFFNPTEESKKTVSFVVESLKKTEVEISENGKLPEKTTLIIRDNPENYDIEVVSTWWDYSCKMDKSNGEIFDEIYGDIEPDEEF